MKWKKRLWSAAFIVVFTLIAIAFTYYFNFYTPRCPDKMCFKVSLYKCDRVSYLYEKDGSSWFYSIKGASNDGCLVYVKLASIKADIEVGIPLQGKDMTCHIPKEIAGGFLPEEKIEYCHGLLKEEIQRLMIEKMHLYIIQNIGQLNQSMISPAI